MNRSVKSTSANRNGTAIALVGAAAHFVALSVLIVACTPRDAESLSDVLSTRVVITGIVGYLMAFVAPRVEYRLLGTGLAFGVWMASIAPELDHKIGGAIGLVLFALGTWALEHVRRLDSAHGA